MASEFRIKVARVSFPLVIEGDGDEILFQHTYLLDLGNKEKLKSLLASCRELVETAQTIGTDDAGLDRAEALAKEIINGTLEDWDRIWELARHNVYCVIGIVIELARIIREDASGALKRYGL